MQTLILITLSCILFFSCNNKNQESDTKKEVVEAKEDLVMYEPSELATLMLEMYTANQDWKAEILKGNIPKEFPEKYKQMHTASSVNESAGSDFYNAMTDAYLSSIEDLTNATPENAKEHYNAMVNVCLNCHNQICPGPIPKINKLVIE